MTIRESTNGGLRKEYGRVENIKSVGEIIQKNVYDMAYDVTPKDDVETYLAIWHDDIGRHDNM